MPLISIYEIWEDPAWLMFIFTFLVGGLGLLALILLYPFSQE